jgi:hypothetical protein
LTSRDLTSSRRVQRLSQSFGYSIFVLHICWKEDLERKI